MFVLPGIFKRFPFRFQPFESGFSFRFLCGIPFFRLRQKRRAGKRAGMLTVPHIDFFVKRKRCRVGMLFCIAIFDIAEGADGMLFLQKRFFVFGKRKSAARDFALCRTAIHRIEDYVRFRTQYDICSSAPQTYIHDKTFVGVRKRHFNNPFKTDLCAGCNPGAFYARF